MRLSQHAKCSLSTSCGSSDGAEQLGLEDVFSFLVLLVRLVGLVILPSDGFVALSAGDVAHNMSARRHVPLARVALRDIDNGAEQVCLAVLATEVLHHQTGLLEERQTWQARKESKEHLEG